MKKKLYAIFITLLIVFNTGLTQKPNENNSCLFLKKINVSDIDARLPKVYLSDWLKQQAGDATSIEWRISKCKGGGANNKSACKEQDMCCKINVILADKRKIALLILKGDLEHNPTFISGLLEKDRKLYQIHNLSGLSSLLKKGVSTKTKNSSVVILPSISSDLKLITTSIEPPSSLEILNEKLSHTLSADLDNVVAPESKGGLIIGKAIKIIPPQYPVKAQRFKISGLVQVKITISEEGKVIDAEAIKGNLLLHDAAIEAVRQWLFTPTILNGSKVTTQTIVDFKFTYK